MNTESPIDIVTGGSGFVGRHLISSLLADGARVVSIDLRAAPAAIASHPLFVSVVGDIRSADLATRLARFGPIRSFYHLAARTGVRAAQGSAADYTLNNVVGTDRICATAERLSAERFIYASSSSLYGDAGEFPTPESAILAPRSHYGTTKMLAEQIVRDRGATGRLDVRIARLFTVYGPDGRASMAIPRFLTASRRGRPILATAPMDSFRDYTWIGDVVTGLRLLASLSNNPGPINLAAGAPTRLADLITMMQRISGIIVPVQQGERDERDVFGTHGSNEKARALGWESPKRLADVLPIMINPPAAIAEGDAGALKNG